MLRDAYQVHVYAEMDIMFCIVEMIIVCKVKSIQVFEGHCLLSSYGLQQYSY